MCVHVSGYMCVQKWVCMGTGVGMCVHRTEYVCAQEWVYVCTKVGICVYRSGHVCACTGVGICVHMCGYVCPDQALQKPQGSKCCLDPGSDWSPGHWDHVMDRGVDMDGEVRMRLKGRED